MGMINIDSFRKGKHIQFIYKIIKSEMDSWDAIGYRNTIINLELIFFCKCSDIKGLDITSISKYYQDAIQAWNIFQGHVLRIILNRMDDKWNWISKWVKIKKMNTRKCC